MTTRYNGAPALDAHAYITSPKGRATIRKASALARRLRLVSVGDLAALTTADSLRTVREGCAITRTEGE